MRKLLCLVCFTVALCALFLQSASAAELPIGETTSNFEGTIASVWRDLAQSGGEIGKVLYARLDAYDPYSFDGEEYLPDSAGREIMSARFTVMQCIYGEYEEQSLSLITFNRANAFNEGQYYIIRVSNETPRILDPRKTGTYLSASIVGDWTLIDTLPVIGGIVYVPSGYYSDLATFLDTESTPILDDSDNTKTATITGNRVNVRVGAGTSYRSLGKLDKGDVVTVLGEKGNWTRIAYNGEEAYVSSRYVSLD